MPLVLEYKELNDDNGQMNKKEDWWVKREKWKQNYWELHCLLSYDTLDTFSI